MSLRGHKQVGKKASYPEFVLMAKPDIRNFAQVLSPGCQSTLILLAISRRVGKTKSLN
jgi:hypothetical protein